MAAHSLPRPQFAHLADIQPRPRLFQGWERVRHRQAHWFVECAAEFVGVFLYVFAGVGSTAPFILGNILGQPLSSILQIGLAYALGIVFALVICSSTSGGHFNPAVTLSLVIFRKFPRLKALRYIIAQILGAYVACLLIYVQYRQMISEAEAVLTAKGALEAVNFTANGPAGIFALYEAPGTPLGRVFLNEFVCCFAIGLVIWACLDNTNFLVAPPAMPWLVGMAYCMSIWGFSPVGVALNSARDIGARMMALTIWGTAAGGGSYSAIAALANIPATLLAVLFYEVVLLDSSRVIAPSRADFLAAHLAHAEHSQQIVMSDTTSSYETRDKEQTESVEQA